MKQFLYRFLRLMAGLFLYALGIVFTLNANIGYSPWDVLHSGISRIVGLSIGTISILVGLGIVILGWLLDEKIGLGTILNMLTIGMFIDIILNLRILPIADSLLPGIAMLISGLYIISIGSFFYIDTAFGVGPRDSLMIAISRKTGYPIGLCRGSVEVLAALTGWLMGGMLGIGSVISALAVGICVQSTFKLFRFEPSKVKHETLRDTFISLRLALSRKPEDHVEQNIGK